MFLPEVAVEIAFDAGVLTPAADRIWVDVTDYVELDQGIVIQRGRSDEFQVTSPSTLSLTLDNSDGSFTPGAAASTFYPHVKIGRPIRVIADGTVRFTGYVDEWPVDWPGATDASAHSTLTATSRLARLGEGAELRSVVETEILADNPVAYYPLGESTAAQFAQEFTGSDTVGMYSLHGGSGVAFGTGKGVPTSGLPAAQIYPHKTGRTQRMLAAHFTQPMTECTVECFVIFPPDNVDDTVAAISLYSNFDAGGDVKVLQLRGASIDVDPTTSASFDATYFEIVDGVFNNLGTTTTYATPATALETMRELFDGRVHHLALTFDPGVSPELKTYLDGALFNTKTGATGPLSTSMPQWTLLLLGPLLVDSGNDPMTVAHAAVYDQILSDDRIEAHALAGLDGFSSELAGERVERIVGYGGVELAEVDVDGGTVPISHIDTSNATVESLLRVVEETEGGILYDARDGTLRFRDRDHRYGATAAFTLDVAAQHVESEGFRPVLDRSAITNSVTARSKDGALEQRYDDTASAEDYGHRRRDIELATTDVDQLYQAAAWRVNRYKEPLPRFAALSPVDILTLDDITRDAIRDADISTRFAVANMPVQAPDGVSEFFIEGITETLAPESWRFQFNASPANVYDDLFTVDVSELNSDDVLAY